MTAPLPMLTGYRVLDITQFVAGPTCTRILAELGADVIKVEMAPAGDRGRFSGDKPRAAEFRQSSQSTYYFQHNHSKKSLALNFKHPRGPELIRSSGRCCRKSTCWSKTSPPESWREPACPIRC
jgi:CoA:oxalate CoA-transferase